MIEEAEKLYEELAILLTKHAVRHKISSTIIKPTKLDIILPLFVYVCNQLNI